MQAFIFSGRVVVAGTGRRNEFDFLTHDSFLRRSDALSVSAHVCQALVDAVLVDDAQPFMGQPQAHVALLGLNPESLVL